jgi:hypothetical protein
MSNSIKTFIALFLFIAAISLSPAALAKYRLGEVDSIADLISSDFKQTKRALPKGGCIVVWSKVLW